MIQRRGYYISSYRNSGKYKNLRIGGSLSYRIGNLGRIGVNAYHVVDYYENEDPRKGLVPLCISMRIIRSGIWVLIYYITIIPIRQSLV